MKMKKRMLGVLIFAVSFLFAGIGMARADAFIRGDANSDGRTDLTDAIFILQYLFQGGPSPACQDSADVDDNGRVEITDPIYLLQHLFLGGPAPSEPYPEKGFDRTLDDFSCGDGIENEDEEVSVFYFPEGYALLFEEGVASEILIAKNLDGVYRSVSVHLQEVDSGNEILLYSFSDERGFSFANRELRVFVNKKVQELHHDVRYQLVLKILSLDEILMEKKIIVIGKQITSDPKDLADPKSGNGFIPLTHGGLEPPITPKFCNALKLELYSCKDTSKKILDEKNKETGYTVGSIIARASIPRGFDARTGLPAVGEFGERGKKELNDYFTADTCYIMVGFVEASDKGAVDSCTEGQEVQSTVDATVEQGILYQCLYGYAGESPTMASRLNQPPSQQSNHPLLHCYEHPDDARYCVYHWWLTDTQTERDPKVNFGHSSNYAGDNYHQIWDKEERISGTVVAPDGSKYESEIIVRNTKKEHLELPGVADTPLKGKRFMIYWTDKPGNFDFIEKPSDWDELQLQEGATASHKVVGDVRRSDLFHAYLLSDDCTAEGQKGSDKGKHVCIDIQYHSAYGSLPGQAGRSAILNVVDCKLVD